MSVQRHDGRAAHLRVEGLGLWRDGRWLLRGLSVEIVRGSVVAVSGRSGSGKTTLLRCLAGGVAPDEGHLVFRCAGGCEHGASDYRPRVGLVPQNLLLTGGNTLLCNVLCGRLARYPWWRTLLAFPKAEREAAWRYLDAVGLGRCAHKKAREVSGGEQQRAAVARALFQEPELVLADEPVSSLDKDLAAHMLGMLRERAEREDRTAVCVLHDPALIARFADAELAFGEDGAWEWREVRR